MEVEKTFGFSIPDDDCAVLDTVGKLYDYILAHRFQDRLKECVTNVAFYKLRHALMSVFGMARNDVHLSLDLAAIISVRRRQRWLDLQNATGLRLPELVRPVWVTVMVTAVGCVFVVGATIVLAACGGGFAAFMLDILIIIWLVFYALYQATKPLAVVFGPEFPTVGGLTKSILRRNYGAISDECQRASPEEVWTTLRALIAEEFGVRADDVTKEANFVKDLGVD